MNNYPFDGIDLHVMTLEGNNLARRRVFNRMAKPENCLITYQSALGLLTDLGLDGKTDLMEKVLPGIEYYKALCSFPSQPPKHLLDKLGQKVIDYIRYKWVVSEIPKNKTNIAIKTSVGAI